jgi:transposase
MTLAVMEEILVAGERSEQSNDRRSTALTEEIELRVRRERHRRWRPDEKLRIVQETLRPGAVIADVARRHGIGSGLLYTWRKEMLATTMAGLVPVEVQAEAPLEAPAPVPAASVRQKSASGRIEIEFPDGVRVRVDGAVDEMVLRGVLSTLSGG